MMVAPQRNLGAVAKSRLDMDEIQNQGPCSGRGCLARVWATPSRAVAGEDPVSGLLSLHL